jgi:uncharacterized integral membrane protein
VNAARWLPIAAVTLLAAAFSWFNRGERVVVDLGVATFYRAPFTLVVFLAFLAGMLSMLFLGLRHDLRVRRELQARGLLDGAPAPAVPVSAEPSAPVRAEPDPDDRTLLQFPADPFTGPVPEAESAAIRVVPPESRAAD